MSDIIAIIFDYDDTLVPDSTTQLLNHYGVDTKYFWGKDFKNLVKNGFDATHAYLNLLLDMIGKDKPLKELTNDKLRDFGKEVEKTQFPGLPELVDDIKNMTDKHYMSAEFYVISSGLEEIIKGNKFISDNFRAVYGSRLGSDSNNQYLTYIKRAITFTEKTRFIFEINKGISPEESNLNPMSVNNYVDMDKRRIPFENMMYIGDGLTDIPCFSLLNRLSHNKASNFGIFNKEKDLSHKLKTFEQILKSNRTLGTYYPEYRSDHQLGEKIRLAVYAKCAKKVVDNNPQ